MELETVKTMTFDEFCEAAFQRGTTPFELLAELSPERASLELLE